MMGTRHKSDGRSAPDDGPPVRVMVVDDSPFMRKAIARMLDADPGLTVVATARDGIECLALLEQHQPDVVTLDIVMPNMDGMTALKQMMEHHPVPVVMLSSLTAGGADVSLHALELGAVDVVEKPAELTNMDVFSISSELVGKVKAAAGVGHEALVRLHGHEPEPPATGPVDPAEASRYDVDCVVVGASTGGPAALQRIVASIPRESCQPVVLVQHMPEGFTGALAERLGRVCALEVKEAEDGDVLRAGRVLVARAGMQLRFERRREALVVRLDRVVADSPHMPSIDVSMESAATCFGHRVLGVLLTGMGSDGAEGLLRLARAGAPTIAEAASSAVIFGMPRVAAEIGAAAEVLDLADIVQRVASAVTPAPSQAPEPA